MNSNLNNFVMLLEQEKSHNFHEDQLQKLSFDIGE